MVSTISSKLLLRNSSEKSKKLSVRWTKSNKWWPKSIDNVLSKLILIVTRILTSSIHLGLMKTLRERGKAWTVQLIRDGLLDHPTSHNASNKTKGSLKKTKLRDRCERPLARASSLSLIKSTTLDSKQLLVTHSIIIKEDLLCWMKCRIDLRPNSKIL